MRFTPFWVSLMGDLQKSDCYGLNSERKKVLTSSPGPLTCLLINLSAFGSMNIHFLSEKLILLDFSSPRGVTTLGCEFHSQAGLANVVQSCFKAGLKFVCFRLSGVDASQDGRSGGCKTPQGGVKYRYWEGRC